MTHGRKTGGRNFVKGKVNNPKCVVSPQISAIRKITNENIQEVAEVILDGNIDDLRYLIADPKTSVLQVWIAKAAIEGIRDGNLYSLSIILDRVLGKQTQKIEVSGVVGLEAIRSQYALMTPEELDALADQKLLEAKNESES